MIAIHNESCDYIVWKMTGGDGKENGKPKRFKIKHTEVGREENCRKWEENRKQEVTYITSV